jgi:ATP-dependent helicase HrpA
LAWAAAFAATTFTALCTFAARWALALLLARRGALGEASGELRRAIADGYQLLAELGAVDEANELTSIGQLLAKLPLDPRVGRMLLEARERRALNEVLVIASALSVQDVRDRPLDKQAQADQQHAKFDDDKSEFVSYLKLWHWLEQARGGRPSSVTMPLATSGVETRQALPPSLPRPVAKSGADKAAGRGTGLPEAAPQHKLSNRQYENLLRETYINVRRVREWRDIHSQLLSVVKEQAWKINAEPASYEQLHLSMLCGLLGNIGCKSDEDDFYLGARGIKFNRHPGARLSKRPGRWIVAAELVETQFNTGLLTIPPLKRMAKAIRALKEGGK